MKFNIIQTVNALLELQSSLGNSSYLQLGNSNCHLFRSINASNKTLVFKKPLGEKGIVMSTQEYLSKYSVKYDVIYYGPNSEFEASIGEIKEVTKLLNSNGVVVMNYYFPMTAKVALYLRAFHKQLRIDSVSMESGIMLLIRAGGEENVFSMSKEEISTYKNITLSKGGKFDVNDLDDNTKALFDFKENDHVYEVLRSRCPTLKEHLSSLFA